MSSADSLKNLRNNIAQTIETVNNQLIKLEDAHCSSTLDLETDMYFLLKERTEPLYRKAGNHC